MPTVTPTPTPTPTPTDETEDDEDDNEFLTNPVTPTIPSDPNCDDAGRRVPTRPDETLRPCPPTPNPTPNPTPVFTGNPTPTSTPNPTFHSDNYQLDGMVQFTFGRNFCGGATATECQNYIDSIYIAARQLNTIETDPGGGNVKFCQRADDPTAYLGRAPICPTTVNGQPDDGYTVTIYFRDIADSDSHKCSNPVALACIAPTDTTDEVDHGEPMKNLDMYIMAPGYVYESQRRDAQRLPVQWLVYPGKHGDIVDLPNGEYPRGQNIWLPAIGKQEFINAAGSGDADGNPECVTAYNSQNIADFYVVLDPCDENQINQTQRIGESR